MSNSSTDPGIPRDPLLAVWPHLVPSELSAALRADADAVVKGTVTFFFHGNHPIPVGRKDIDWSGAHREHQEWPAQLNRFYMFRPLLAAWRYTGGEEYAQAARDYLEDWMRANPTQENWTMGPGDNRLTLALRLGNSAFPGWSHALFAFAGSEAFDTELQARALDSLQAQLNFLVDDMTEGGNWRIAQADTLVASAVRFPDLKGANRWLAKGVEVLNNAVREQFLPDGAHIERTPNYHSWMTQVLYHYWALGRVRADLGLEIKTDLVRRAFQFWIASTRPNGETNRLHDTASGAPSQAARDQYMAFLFEAGLEDAGPIPSFFPDAGQVLLRDNDTADATYLTFDASRYGGGHCHLGCNAIQVDVKGRPILVDPGILDYEPKNPLMAHGKSTRAHNTINLNGWIQAPLNHVPCIHIAGAGYDFIRASYEGGYWPSSFEWRYVEGCQDGVWGRHDRTLLWVRDRYILVTDTMTHWMKGETPPAVECNWQFEQGELLVDTAKFEAVSRNPDANLLLRVVYRPENSVLELHEGEMHPPRGWTAGGDKLAPAPQISLLCPAQPHYLTRIVTILLPFEGENPPELQAMSVEGSDGRITKIQLDGETDYVFQDAEPFHYRMDGIRFYGTAGLIRRVGGETEVFLPAAGQLIADKLLIERE